MKILLYPGDIFMSWHLDLLSSFLEMFCQFLDCLTTSFPSFNDVALYCLNSSVTSEFLTQNLENKT